MSSLGKGFLVGAGLIIVGLVLQLSIGPIRWSLFAWPVNIVVLAVLLLFIVVFSILSKGRRNGGKGSKARHSNHLFGVSGWASSVPAICYAAVLTVVMGLTRQSPSGSWLNDMLTFWPFVLIYAYLVLVLGLIIVRQLRTASFRPSLLSHLGLFIALTTATLGNADMQRLQMWTTNNAAMANELSDSDIFHQYEHYAVDDAGLRVELPLAIELKRFIMELYDDGITPRRYASEVIIYSKSTLRQYAATIDVNKPVKVDGWKIYQKDYRLTDAGDACQVSILELVRDPWLPWVYAGIFIMLAGALFQLLKPISLKPASSLKERRMEESRQFRSPLLRMGWGSILLLLLFVVVGCILFLTLSPLRREDGVDFWDNFVYFAVASLLLWAAGAWFAWIRKVGLAIVLTAIGLCIFFTYILGLWIALESPPLRTLGDTRLWYSLFLPLVGLFVYSRWRYRWILTFSTIMSAVFVSVNLFKPELHTTMLMPALQSPWFAPHVIVYMFAYAMLGASFLVAVWMLFKGEKSVERGEKHVDSIDNLVNVGLAFMTFGMLFGALWAKEAWGHYWSWDPKETWAAATWMGYLCYIHYRRYSRHRPRIALWMLIVCFLLLQVCWWGINYLPSAQGTSVHTY